MRHNIVGEGPGSEQFRRAIGADRSWMDALDRGPWQISCAASRLSPSPLMTNVEFQKTIRPRGTVTDAQPHALPAALNRMQALGCPTYVRIG